MKSIVKAYYKHLFLLMLFKQFLLLKKKIEEVIELIDEKDPDAVFVEIHGTNLEKGITELKPDTIYNLTTNKYIKVENELCFFYVLRINIVFNLSRD